MTTYSTISDKGETIFMHMISGAEVRIWKDGTNQKKKRPIRFDCVSFNGDVYFIDQFKPVKP